jgi:5-methylcytosine-specific restriction endonuclease McrA
MARKSKKEKIIEEQSLSPEEKQAKFDTEKEKKRRKALRNEITHKLRFKILERDNYTCQYCGNSPKTVPGTQLEVDHIIPLEKGGDNRDENLTTACWECNEGKKNVTLKPPTKTFTINKEKIFEVAKTNDFDVFKKFLTDPENEEERQYLFDYNDRLGRTFCIKNCEECCGSGTWWFKGCIQKLNRAAHGSMDEALDVQRESEAVVPAGGALEPTNGKNGQGIVIKGSKYEKLECDRCYAALRCPQYKVGASCAFDWGSDMNFANVEEGLKYIAGEQGMRIMKALYFEKIDGGAIDKNVSNEIMNYMRIMKDIVEMGQPSASISVEAKGTGEQGVGIIQQLVESLRKDEEKGVKEVEAEEVEEAEVIKEEDKS